MLAKEASIGDIIDIPSNGVGHNPWEVISYGHPRSANAIEVKPIFENTFPQRYDNYHLNNSTLITVRNSSTIEFNDQKPEYLFHRIKLSALYEEQIDDAFNKYINDQVKLGYELVSITDGDILMVKYD